MTQSDAPALSVKYILTLVIYIYTIIINIYHIKIIIGAEIEHKNNLQKV